MRDAFSKSLVRYALADPSVVLLTGDHGYSLFDEFRKVCPTQYFNAGIAEQNMVGMAAGLARVGFRPFVYGLAAFIPIRVVEQIKLDIAHDELPVVLLGDGAGLVYSHLGTSHQSTEDVACMSAVPNVEILSPCDRHEMTACMDYAYNSAKPVYMRIGKSDRGDVHNAPLTRMESGALVLIRPGELDMPAIVATGSMVKTAMQVADEFGMAVWSAPCLKPINSTTVIEIAKSFSGIITLEEHSTHGGLGGLICEIVSEHVPVRVLRIGVEDRFSAMCGSYDYLLREHCIDFEAIRDRITAFYRC